MRNFGFSTGAIALGDFALGARLSAKVARPGCSAIELSALRLHELGPLLDGLSGLDLSRFSYVAIHAPSRFEPSSEGDIASALCDRAGRYNIVLHPDAIHSHMHWRRLGERLCIENTDKRKQGGRTCSELEKVFAVLPDASFCLDLGHARQVDPTMVQACEMLRVFGDRLRQVHLSDVTTMSHHETLSLTAVIAFRGIAKLLPERTPIILESIIDQPPTVEKLEHELGRALSALPQASEQASAEKEHLLTAIESI